MIRDHVKTSLMMVMAALAMPLVSAGGCLTPDQATDPADNGYATAVQADQGNGSIDCTAFTGPGGSMFQIPVQQDKLVGTVTPLDPINWTVTDPDPDVNVDVLFIGNSDGSRCTQYYKGNARSGFAAAGTKSNKAATIVACADGFSEALPPPPPTPPIATDQANGCTGIYQPFQDAIDASPDFHGLILFGPGVKEGNSGICTSKNLGNGVLKRCVNRCIKPEPDAPNYDPTLAACSGDGPFFPIECRACELSSVVQADPTDPNVEYCWEQIQKVENGQFKKAPGSKGEQVWGIDRKHGSDCYLINGRTASGWPYSYWFPSSCPN